MNQPSALPTKKVTAAAVGGAIVVLLRWFLSFAEIDLPGDVATAIVTLIVAVGSAYMVQERPGSVDR